MEQIELLGMMLISMPGVAYLGFMLGRALYKAVQ